MLAWYCTVLQPLKYGGLYILESLTAVVSNQKIYVEIHAQWLLKDITLRYRFIITTTETNIRFMILVPIWAVVNLYPVFCCYY